MKYLRVILIVLLLGCCTLWVASYWHVRWISPGNSFAIGLDHGSFKIETSFFVYIFPLEFEHFPRNPSHWWPVVWIYTDYYSHVIYGTLWLPTLLLVLPLANSASPWARRRRRAKQGLCIRCGYDLGGMEHDACPECGTNAGGTINAR